MSTVTFAAIPVGELFAGKAGLRHKVHEFAARGVAPVASAANTWGLNPRTLAREQRGWSIDTGGWDAGLFSLIDLHTLTPVLPRIR